MPRLRPNCLPGLAALALLAAAPLAHAAPVAVEPRALVITGLQGAGHVDVRNTTDEAMRLYLSLEALEPGPDGRDVIGRTEDLIVFPIRFTLEPGASRTIRVGYVAVQKPRDVERLYRLVVHKRAEDEVNPVLRHIAVSVMPKGPIIAPTVAVDGQSGDLVAMHLRNRGTVTFAAKAVHLRAVPLSGEPVLTSVAGWYVRPRRQQHFSVALPEGFGCLKALTTQVETLDGVLHPPETLSFEPDACSAPLAAALPDLVAPVELPEVPLPGVAGWLPMLLEGAAVIVPAKPLPAPRYSEPASAR